jgi:FemAB-related protein (PEP-CTERM system-associated)
MASPQPLTVRVLAGSELRQALPRLADYAIQGTQVPHSRHPGWLLALEQGLGHRPFCLEAAQGEQTRGILPLASMRSLLFGRFLVSLPYLNYGGVLAEDAAAATLLVDRAVQLADELKVRYLELRQDQGLEHPALPHCMASKVHMRLELPATSEELWKAISGKIRNQVRKGQKSDLTVVWGGAELLAEFYAVFSHNMRDLGTPTFGRRLFASILAQFPDRAELCVVRAGPRAVAGALLTHGWGSTEVQSASSLRQYNATCANMLMYWHLLERAVERRQAIFDFGRTSRDSNTYRFKEQWGAREAPTEWQYYLRRGSISDMRPDNPRNQRLIRCWQRLPVSLSRLLGPRIARGIP